MMYENRDNGNRGYSIYFKTSLGLYAILAGLIGSGMLWELRQPKQKVENAKVESINYYYRNGGDLHNPIARYEVSVEGVSKQINFPVKYWDPTVKEGDVVDVIYRKSFPLFGGKLDGFEIDDHEKFE